MKRSRGKQVAGTGAEGGATSLAPLISVGVPVYQGEQFLDETLYALRKQDYPNLEIVISDNASTDRTSEIIAHHESDDERVRSIHQDTNIGAAENYNEVFRASSGVFFAWNAHDDLTTSDFFRLGCEALDSDPIAVVAIARPFRVDIDGEKLEEFDISEDLYSVEPHVRFRAAARSAPASLIFGIYRREQLESTGLHGHFAGSDRNLVAEAMLYGRVTHAGNSEFHLREHQHRSVRSHGRSGDNRLSHDRNAWYDPTRENRLVFPNWRRFGSYIAAVTAAPLGIAESLRCYLTVGQLLFDDRMKLGKQLVYDLLAGASYLTSKYLKPHRLAADSDVVDRAVG